MTTTRLTFRANGEANSYALIDADTGKWFMSLLVNGEQLTEQQEANLRRLAITWNACNGIPTQSLERVLDDPAPIFELLMQTTKERDQAMRERDELVEQIRRIQEATATATANVSGKPGHTCTWVDTQPSGSKCTTCGDTLPF